MKWFRLLCVLMMAGLARSGLGQDASVESQEKHTGAVQTVIVPQLRALPRPYPDLPEVIEARTDQNDDRTDAAADTKLPVGCPGGGNREIVVPSFNAQVSIQNRRADTRLNFRCENPGNKPVKAPIALPLPQNAEISQNTQKIKERVGAKNRVLSAKEALPEWQKMAKKLKSPASIEFCGQPMLKTGPLDVPAGESQSVTFEYRQTLRAEPPRYDYLLPRSESVQNAVPWSLDAEIRSDEPISTLFCPTHKIQTQRQSAQSFQVKLDDQDATQPGTFWLSYLIDQGTGLSATLFTQPDDSTPDADGTFLFLAGGPANPSGEKAISRELTLALDRSGSMQGQKIEQVRAAASQVIEQLNEGESFNIITYNNQVSTFAEKPVPKTDKTLAEAKAFIQAVKPRGGTNLHGALLESVRQQPAPEALPIVLFLTDGLPTVGETAEVKIRDVVAKQNPYNRRIFTVGVGVDVNTPLLETIASETRAAPTFVLPEDDVQTKLAHVFQNLKNPILADAKLEILKPTGESAGDRVSDVYPNPLPDLFQDDHLVVLGRYRGTEPLTFRIRGNFLGTRKAMEFTFPLKDRPASPFVSRLWATRKIAALVQKIRKSGATADPYVILANPKQDPQLKTLAEEILKLTTRYGILTEYTAFLAKEGDNWPSRREQLELAYRNFDERAVKTRVGLSSVNQSINNSILQRQNHLNSINCFWDAEMRRVTLPNVQQLGKGAFFRRGETWVDSRLVDRPNLTPKQTVTFGSSTYDQLVDRLVKQGEHTPLSLGGDVLLEVDNQPILIREPTSVGRPPYAGTASQEPRR